MENTPKDLRPYDSAARHGSRSHPRLEDRLQLDAPPEPIDIDRRVNPYEER